MPSVPPAWRAALIPATINPHHPLPTAKSDFDARAGKIGMYLRFNPDETVLALGNASIVRWHAGRAQLVAGSGWIYRASGRRELALAEDIPELAPMR